MDDYFAQELQRIQVATAAAAGVTVRDLKGPGRAPKVERARMLGMYMSRQMTNASNGVISRAWGRKNRWSAQQARKHVEERLESDPEYKDLADKIARGLALQVDTDSLFTPDSISTATEDESLAAIQRAKTEPDYTLKGRPDQIRSILAATFGENCVASARSRSGGTVEVHLSNDGGWTILRIDEDGNEATIIDCGTSWFDRAQQLRALTMGGQEISIPRGTYRNLKKAVIMAASGVSRREIAAEAGCSMRYVSKVRNEISCDDQADLFDDEE